LTQFIDKDRDRGRVENPVQVSGLWPQATGRRLRPGSGGVNTSALLKFHGAS